MTTLHDGAVLCSHGDVIPDVISALERRGMHIAGDPDWRKATVWVLERDGDTFAKGKVWSPPSVR
jgi:8-oxo-dGTP diphosphatase